MIKKLWIGIIIMCIILCFSGCSPNSITDVIPPTATNVPANENPGSEGVESTENEAVEPPEILDLDSFEKIAELKSMLDEEDDVVADYLDSNNYSMNGLSSKSDITEFFDHVGDLNMVHMDPSSGYNVTSILYYPECDYDYFMSIYSNGIDRILFRCFVDTSDGVYVPEADAVRTLCIGDKKVALYELEDEGAYALVGRTETANSLITIMFSDDDEEKIRNTIEGNIVCLTLNELIEGDKTVETDYETPPEPTVVPEKKTLSERIIVKTKKGTGEEEQPFLYRVKHDDKYGAINQFGEVVVEPIYEYMDGFVEGYAEVYQDKKFGYIDENGNLLTGIEFDTANAFSEGMAAVRVGDLYGYIDTTGQFVLEPQYGWAHSFSDGLACVLDQEKGWRYISKDGTTALVVDYENHSGFHDGLAWVKMTVFDCATYGYINKTGKMVIYPISDGRLMDLSVEDFSEGFGIMYIEKSDDTIRKVYVNTEGEILGGYQFEEAFEFSEGLAYAERDGICGYIDKTGEYVITGVSPSSFRGGLASCIKDGKVGFIDKTGRYVIEPMYDDCYAGFGKGYGVVSEGEVLICINKSGGEMWRLLPEE